MPIRHSFFALLMTAITASGQLANPDFEEDADNVGFPDGWTVAPNAQASVLQEGASSGRRALQITGGYGAVSQDLDLTAIAGRQIVLSLDARSPDAARFGVRVGYFVHDDAKGPVWTDAPMIWDRELKTGYENLRATRIIPENALDGRFWFCLYRSKSEGTVIVDHISLELLDPSSTLDARDSIRLQREFDTLMRRINDTETRQPNLPLRKELIAEAEKIRDAARQSGEVTTAFNGFQALNARLIGALYPAQSLVASWVGAFEQQQPQRLPAEATALQEITTLAGEVASFGAEVTNTTPAPQTLTLVLEGEAAAAASKVEIRKQVLMETWYTKGATLVADPLVLLEKKGDTWELPLVPGETVRLYLSLNIAGDAKSSSPKGTLRLRIAGEEKTLPFSLELIGKIAPTQPKLAHYQFLYSNQNVVNRTPEAASRDLEAHGVTDIEWAFMPSATFEADGRLANVGWGAHTRWLNGFRDSNIRLNIFWMKKLFTADKTELPYLSPEWKEGWKAILSSYLDYAETLGLPRSRFTILPMDEIHSRNYEDAPDENITGYLEIAKATREAEPDLAQYLTIGNYAFPADIQAVIGTLNVAMPHWPRPEKLSRNAPPNYKAREDYFANTHPALLKAREEKGLQLWSYRVQSGKSDDVLRYSRGYPVLAVANGYTGFGYWAYNVSAASTWDDSDGKILDYILVYDGAEEHPLNRLHNPTGEGIVPSIRWKAIYASQQDGQILLHLLTLAQQENCPAPLRAEIEALHQRYLTIGGEYGYGSPALSFEALEEAGRDLRRLYAKVETQLDPK